MHHVFFNEGAILLLLFIAYGRPIAHIWYRKPYNMSLLRFRTTTNDSFKIRKMNFFIFALTKCETDLLSMEITRCIIIM